MVKRMNKIRLLVIALTIGLCSPGCDSLFENPGAPSLDESVETEEKVKLPTADDINAENNADVMAGAILHW